MPDDIKLPPLPKPDDYIPRTLTSGEVVGIGAITQMHAVEFARAAVLADRERRQQEIDAALAEARNAGLQEAIEAIGIAWNEWICLIDVLDAVRRRQSSPPAADAQRAKEG